MGNFDWAAFAEKSIAVHCATEDEAIDFCNLSHEHGYDWCDGNTRLEEINWNYYNKNTVYFRDSYADIEYTKTYMPNCKIIEWSDYVSLHVFMKSDLKTGDFILYRNGSVEMVLREYGALVGVDGYNRFENMNNDLSGDFDGGWDVMEVRRPKYSSDCQFSCFDSEDGEAVYNRERDSVVEMTLKEVCEALGKNIKIVENNA